MMRKYFASNMWQAQQFNSIGTANKGGGYEFERRGNSGKKSWFTHGKNITFGNRDHF